jgi:hypothetical protein
MPNVKLSDRQEEIRSTVKKWSNSGSLLTVLVGETITDYYGKDSHSCDNLAFLINELHNGNHKQYLNALKRILPLYVMVDLSFSKAGDNWNVCNTKGTPKSKKEKGEAANLAFEWENLKSLLQHPSLLVANKGKKKVKKESEVSFKDAVLAELEKGTSLDEMIALLHMICTEAA